MKRIFKITNEDFYEDCDKEIKVEGASLDISIYFDDIDIEQHEQIIADTKKMVRILNKYWDYEEVK